MSQRHARSYDKEFKIGAVKLYLESGRTYKQISQELGVADTTLAGWVSDYKKDDIDSFPGKGQLKPGDVEISQLCKELAVAREERDILKKALGIFSSTRR